MARAASRTGAFAAAGVRSLPPAVALVETVGVTSLLEGAAAGGAVGAWAHAQRAGRRRARCRDHMVGRSHVPFIPSPRGVVGRLQLVRNGWHWGSRPATGSVGPVRTFKDDADRRALAPRRRILAASIVLVAVTGAANAWAYRPFDGTDADVAGLGDFEVELGPVHWYSQNGSHYAIAPATVLNLGYLPGCELVVDFENFVGIDTPLGQPRDQLLDTDVLTKVVLLPGVLQGVGRGPSGALELGPLLPNVNGESGFGASSNLLVSERLGGAVVHFNNWLELTRGSLHVDWFEGMIVEWNVEAPVRPVSEWFVEHEFVANVTTVSGLLGGIWRARDGLDFDFGLREASVGGQRASEVRLGLTWTVGVWHPQSAPKGEGGP